MFVWEIWLDMDMQPKKEIFNDVWIFYKKWLPECSNDERWVEIIKEADTIIKKHNSEKLAIDLLQAMIGELGRVQKG